MVDFLDEPRGVTFDWHIVQAKKWLAHDGGRELDSTLVYASLELRLAIERYFFELMFLLKGCQLTPEEEKRCRSLEGIAALMKETDENYRKTIEFTKIYASRTPGIPEITIVDTSFLRRQWHKLSEYCHKQLSPEQTFDSPGRSFQEEGFRLIEGTIKRFSEWEHESNCGILQPSTMPEEVRSLYERFVSGEADADQVKTSLRLMAPVLGARLARLQALRLGR